MGRMIWRRPGWFSRRATWSGSAPIWRPGSGADRPGDGRFPGKLALEAPAESALWQGLIHQVTTAESYFFRDRGQFDLLRRKLLPELIEGRPGEPTAADHERRMLHRRGTLFPGHGPRQNSADLEEWDIEVLGVDLDREILVKARLGCFGKWSFRHAEHIANDSFSPRRGGTSGASGAFRAMVRFERLNLAGRRRIPSGRVAGGDGPDPVPERLYLLSTPSRRPRR